MSSIALDIRVRPDRSDDLDDTGDDAGREAAARADGTAAPAPDHGPPARSLPVPTRLRCAACGMVLGVDDEPPAAWRIPVHAIGTSAGDPFAVRECPGSGGPADPVADAVPGPAPLPPAAPPTVLPADLHWRDQPFSHGSA